MITLGTDTEVQIQDKTGDLISAVGLIGGSKENPRWFDGFNIQEDNTNVEFAINPVSTVDEWVSLIESAMSKVSEVLGELGYTPRIEATGHYSDEQLSSPESRLFGCDPDFSAYTLDENEPPNPEQVGSLRSAGGHIHVGVEDVNVTELVKWMDVYLGLPSLLMDDDHVRRQLYGKAGAHRVKPYGVEYRALSNFWIKDRKSMVWAYEQTMKAVKMAGESTIEQLPDWTRIPMSIDTYDRNTAEDVLNWLNKEGYNA
jgi:hypothetical protein